MKKKIKEAGGANKRKYTPPVVNKTNVINRFYLACEWDPGDPGCGECLQSSCA